MVIKQAAIDSIVLNHLKYVLNYRQVRSDKKVELFRAISYEKLLKTLKHKNVVQRNIAKGIQEILENIRNKVEDYLPGLKYSLEKDPWSASILFSFTLTSKLLLEHDHGELIKYLTIINEELNKIPNKIYNLFRQLNEIAENKAKLDKILVDNGFEKTFDEYDTVYSKQLKLKGFLAESDILENFIKSYENLALKTERTRDYLTVDIKITGYELPSELINFLQIVDQYFEEYRGGPQKKNNHDSRSKI